MTIIAIITTIAIITAGVVAIDFTLSLETRWASVLYYFTFLSVIALGTVSLIWVANTLV